MLPDMPEASSNEYIRDDEAHGAPQSEVHYCDAVYDLLQKISSIGLSSHADRGEGVLSFIEAFMGAASTSANIEPLLRSEIERQDTSGSLTRWLRGIPHRLFGRAAYDMGCTEIDRADTKEEAVNLFLAHFGYREGQFWKRPEGIWAAREITEDAKRKLEDCTQEEVDSVIGPGTRICKAIESTLQILVLFYGQFILPEGFSRYVARRQTLARDRNELEAWWGQYQAGLETGHLKNAVHDFLVTYKTQIELSLRLLKELESAAKREPALSHFALTFGRGSIFPLFDAARMSARTSVPTNAEFIHQLEMIKELRNRTQHSDQYVPEDRVTPDPIDTLRKCQALAEASSFFFESGNKHGLFPEVVLVRGKSQNVHRRWRVYSTDERGDEFSFPIAKLKIGDFIPGNEMFCWWRNGIRSGEPSVAAVKLSRDFGA